MNTSTRSQFIFVNTKNRDNGEPYDFKINFDSGFIQAQEGENIKISLVKLTLPLVINQVNSTNNSLTFINHSNQHTTVIIPNGSYNVYELIKVIQQQYPLMSSATFDKSRNYFIFNFFVEHRIIFNGKSRDIFGFSEDVLTPSTTITSTKPAKPNSIDNIVFNLYGISPYAHNLDNLGGNLKFSHAIAVLEIDDIPYGTLRYNNLDGEFAISSHDKHIKSLHFVMTDTDGQVLNYANLPNFTFVLKIEYEKVNDDMNNVLHEIKEYQRAVYLHTALGNIQQ